MKKNNTNKISEINKNLLRHEKKKPFTFQIYPSLVAKIEVIAHTDYSKVGLKVNEILFDNVINFEVKNGEINGQDVDFWKQKRRRKAEPKKNNITLGVITLHYLQPSNEESGEWFSITDILSYLNEKESHHEVVQSANIVSLGREISKLGFKKIQRSSGKNRSRGYWVKKHKK